MKKVVERIVASAARTMWQEEPTLGAYTAATAEHELNLAFHFAQRLHRWLPFFDCDFDIQKPFFEYRRPDIIFHRRGAHEANFLIVEVKRRGDLKQGSEDLEKIRHHWFQEPLLYRFGASVVFDEVNQTTKLCVLMREQEGGSTKFRDADRIDYVSVVGATELLALNQILRPRRSIA